jgi:hypothetical protein
MTQLLTLRVVNTLFGFFSPLIVLLQILLVLLAIPFLFILDAIFQALLPFLRMLGNVLTRLFPQQSNLQVESTAALDSLVQGLVNLTPYFRLLGVALVLLALGWWIARALNRRMNHAEEAMVAREPMGDAEQSELERPRPPRARRATPREIHAENIRRIYAALQAQAEKAGFGRREAETPNEYLPRLVAQFPEADAELGVITNAYVAVHYAQQEPTEAQVRQVRADWQRARERMAARTRAKPPTKSRESKGSGL